jgi:hypothetical protein
MILFNIETNDAICTCFDVCDARDDTMKYKARNKKLLCYFYNTSHYIICITAYIKTHIAFARS